MNDPPAGEWMVAEGTAGRLYLNQGLGDKYARQPSAPPRHRPVSHRSVRRSSPPPPPLPSPPHPGQISSPQKDFQHVMCWSQGVGFVTPKKADSAASRSSSKRASLGVRWNAQSIGQERYLYREAAGMADWTMRKSADYVGVMGLESARLRYGRLNLCQREKSTGGGAPPTTRREGVSVPPHQCPLSGAHSAMDVRLTCAQFR